MHWIVPSQNKTAAEKLEKRLRAAPPPANGVVPAMMSLAAPSRAIDEKFDRLVRPIHSEAKLLAVKVQNLRRTLNLLHPHLLSGQISQSNN
jgi:hypothetical protein